MNLPGDFAGEFPEGSALQHRGTFDSGGNGFGFDVDYRLSFLLDLGGSWWSVGLIGRWLPTEIDFTINNAIVPAHQRYLEATVEEDFVTVGLLVARRF